MKFKNILDWLEFVNKTPIEKLSQIFYCDHGIYFSLDDYQRLVIKEPLLADIMNKLSKTNIEEKFWDSTLNYIHTDSLTEDILTYLINNKIALVSLGHHSLDNAFLWKLADYVDEAVLTLGKRYYLDSKYSTEEFSKFMVKFNSNKWLWETLLNLKSFDTKKQYELRKLLFSITVFSDLKAKFIEERISSKLMVTKGLKIIRKYYTLNNAKYMNAIAQNPLTPSDILFELVNITNSKYANQIRKHAKNNIEKNKKRSTEKN